MNEKKFWANKKLGQHFLVNQAVIQKIIAQCPSSIDGIIEVGPGSGALTKPLLALEKNFWVIEKDPRFVQLWQENEKCMVIDEDALNCNWEILEHQHQWNNKSIWLVSNLPYNISAPLTRLFLDLPYISAMTLMYQKEVADKFLGLEDGKYKMNSLHFLLSSHFEITLVCNVKPGSFNPPPKVDSAVLHFKRKVKPLFTLTEIDSMETWVRRIFSAPRKQLKSILKEYLTNDEKMNPFWMRRAETLAPIEVLNIYQQFKLKNKSI